MKKLLLFADIQLFADEGAESVSAETGDDFADAGQGNFNDGDAENEFAQLISGKFKEQFTKKTQAIIDKRFKETKNLEEYRDKVSPIMASLMEKYGISEGEEDSLLEKIQNSEEQRQNENPQSVQNEDRIGALRQRADGWARESIELKNTYPDFDLRKELRGNKLFATLLMGGAPVRAAFETVHRDELLSGAMAYTADKVREEVVRSIESKGRRPLENGVSSESAVVTALDVNSLTSKDILKILKEVENGADIRF